MPNATSKKMKVDVADKTALAEKTVSKEEETKIETSAVKKAEVNEVKEIKQTDNKNGLPFTVKDGLVEVVCLKRAGKSVIATTGDIITFDEKGFAKVKFDDAMHFSKMADFTFK